MKPSKFIQPNEYLTVVEIYRRQFGHTTTPVNYEIYIRTVLFQCLIRYIGVKLFLKNLLTRQATSGIIKQKEIDIQ